MEMRHDLPHGIAGAETGRTRAAWLAGWLTLMLLLPLAAAPTTTHAASGPPSLVADINVGATGSNPGRFTAFKEYLYFAGPPHDEFTGFSRTDGTAVEPVPGFDSIFEADVLFTFDDSLFVWGEDQVGTAIWRHDGVSSELVRRDPPELIPIGESLYYLKPVADALELWRTDGPAGTDELIDSVSASSPGFYTGLVIFQGHLYFWMDFKLWRTDGLAIERVGDLVVSSMGGDTDMTALVDHLYFYADVGLDQDQMWRTDGTTTEFVFDVTPSPLDENVRFWDHAVDNYPYFAHNGYIYFGHDDGTRGTELWRTDGTTTDLVADINEGAGHSSPLGFASFDGDLYFWADDGITGHELWRFDGTSTQRVADIWPGSGSGYINEMWLFPAPFVPYAGRLYFAADDGTHGFELWSTDGSTAEMVADLNPGSADGIETASTFNGFSAHAYGELNGILYFAADDGTHGEELWKLTAEGADTAPPETTITSGLSGTISDSTPAFSFTSSEAGSSFECQVDGGAFTVCSSPHTITAVGEGAHTFAVRATDAAGNVDPSPATRAFTLDLPDSSPPANSTTSSPAGGSTSTGGNHPEASSLSLSGVRLNRRAIELNGPTSKRRAVLTFELSRGARVTLTIAGRKAGVQRGKRCVKQTSRHKGRRCDLPIISFSRSMDAGSNEIVLSGRMHGSRLKPGRYLVTLVVRTSNEAAKTKRLTLRVRR